MFEVLHYTAVHNMFHYFATHSGEGDWSVVCWVCFVAFLENRHYVSFLPVIGDYTLA